MRRVIRREASFMLNANQAREWRRESVSRAHFELRIAFTAGTASDGVGPVLLQVAPMAELRCKLTTSMKTNQLDAR